MLQIYDRVLSSYSLPTLYAITVAAVVSLIVMGLLEFVRSRLLVRCGGRDRSISQHRRSRPSLKKIRPFWHASQ